MKRLFCVRNLILILTVGLTLWGCTSSSRRKVQTYVPGVYEGRAYGVKSEIVVNAEFSLHKIEQITIVSQDETVRVAQPALDLIPARILETQSLGVDAITSCTVTSLAVLAAVEDCAVQAGADLAALMIPPPAPRRAANETVEADVIVVGAGLAGISASLAALDQGAKVILFEKNDVAGGSSKLSGGFITGVQTDMGRQAGWNESFDDFMQYWIDCVSLSEREDVTSLAAVRTMIERSNDDIKFLAAHGIGLQEPTGFGMPALRWHFSDWRNGFMDGAVAGGVDHIVRGIAYLENQPNCTIYYSSPVTEITTGQDGRLNGVVARAKDGHTITAKASSVILATGGFARSKELMARFCPTFPTEWVLPYTTASVGTTGDGIVLAETLGADVYDGWWMDLALAVTPGYFESPLNFAMRDVYFVVDGEGKRVYNTAVPLYGVRSIRISEAYNATGAVWAIVDASMAAAAAECEKKLDGRNVIKADTLDALARATGMDPVVFQGAVDRYNGFAAAGNDPDFGQPSYALQPVAGSPYYAVNLKICTMGSIGGLKTDDSGAVLDGDGKAIPGLYAAGEIMNGKYFNQIYMSGCAQLLCVDSGRNAGTAAALAVR